MSRLLNRIVSRAMSAFVAHGVRVSDDGTLCFPDGLSPDRVQRFIELCVGRRYDCPREAIHDLFLRAGVSPKAVDVLGQIVHEDGGVDVREAAHHWRGLAAALPALQQIPVRFRDFLIVDLDLAEPGCRTLEDALVSTRQNAAARIGCEPSWDAILSRPDEVSALTAAWRARAVRDVEREAEGADETAAEPAY